MADEAIDVARQLIAAPSENPPGDERAVAGIVAELLRSRGVELVETIALSPERPNIIARVDGRKPGKKLMLCGHLDTKPAGDTEDWEYGPFAGIVANGRLYGLGACDMKAGVASIIVALGRLQRTLQRGSVVGVFTADEEAGSGLGARFLAQSRRLEADAAIIAEPAGVDAQWQRLYLGTRGSLLFRVDLEGAAGHSSLADHFRGTSATMAMAQVMILLDQELRRLPGVAVNVGATVEGGAHYAVRAGTASVRSDVRIPPGITQTRIREVVSDAVARFLETSDTEATIIYDELPDGPFEPLNVAAGSAIAEACRAAASEILGRRPPDGIFPGGTDSFFLQGIAGIPTVPAFGPGCLREAHQPNEYVSVEALGIGPGLLISAVQHFMESDG